MRSPPTGRRAASASSRTGRRLLRHDRELGFRFVAGADEAGRGCLAGPLVAAGVLFDHERLTLGQRRQLAALNDSKQQTLEARERLYPVILRAAVPGCICLSDGFAVPATGHEQMAVIDGDARSAAIAAASIIAKVTRDRYMRRIDAIHNGWGFADHVGYATPEHRAAIMARGVSPLHRLSFQSIAYQQLEL